MNKWGVRLISCYFFIWAISDAYRLITGTRYAKGFLGIYLDLNEGGKTVPAIDVMAWVGVVILVYPGVQLLRFNPSGRFWALIVLWLATLSTGAFLIWMIIGVSKGFYYTGPLAISISKQFGETNGTIAVLFVYFAIPFVFFFIPAYYLMRKNTKTLFQHAEEFPAKKLEYPPTPTQDMEPR